MVLVQNTAALLIKEATTLLQEHNLPIGSSQSEEELRKIMAQHHVNYVPGTGRHVNSRESKEMNRKHAERRMLSRAVARQTRHSSEERKKTRDVREKVRTSRVALTPPVSDSVSATSSALASSSPLAPDDPVSALAPTSSSTSTRVSTTLPMQSFRSTSASASNSVSISTSPSAPDSASMLVPASVSRSASRSASRPRSTSKSASVSASVSASASASDSVPASAPTKRKIRPLPIHDTQALDGIDSVRDELEPARNRQSRTSTSKQEYDPVKEPLEKYIRFLADFSNPDNHFTADEIIKFVPSALQHGQHDIAFLIMSEIRIISEDVIRAGIKYCTLEDFILRLTSNVRHVVDRKQNYLGDAVRYDKTDFVKHFLQTSRDSELKPHVINQGLSHGSLASLQLLREDPRHSQFVNDFLRKNTAMNEAILSGNGDLVQWLIRETITPVTNEHAKLACKCGNVGALKACYTRGVLPSPAHSSLAIKHGHLGIIKFLCSDKKSKHIFPQHLITLALLMEQYDIVEELIYKCLKLLTQADFYAIIDLKNRKLYNALRGRKLLTVADDFHHAIKTDNIVAVNFGIKHQVEFTSQHLSFAIECHAFRVAELLLLQTPGLLPSTEEIHTLVTYRQLRVFSAVWHQDSETSASNRRRRYQKFADTACKTGSLRILEFLVQHGVIPSTAGTEAAIAHRAGAVLYYLIQQRQLPLEVLHGICDEKLIEAISCGVDIDPTMAFPPSELLSSMSITIPDIAISKLHNVYYDLDPMMQSLRASATATTPEKSSVKKKNITESRAVADNISDDESGVSSLDDLENDYGIYDL